MHANEVAIALFLGEEAAYKRLPVVIMVHSFAFLHSSWHQRPLLLYW
jgi:hypothetical protein